MTFSVPTPVNAVYVGQRLGRAKKFTTKSSHRRRADICRQRGSPCCLRNDSKQQQNNTSQQTKSSRFSANTPRRYRISEEQSTVKLAHTTHEDAPFFNGEQ